MNKNRTIARILCLILIVAMFPLVKVSAASYSDSYQTLVKYAKKGDSFKEDDPDIGRYKVYYNGTNMNNHYYEVNFVDFENPGADDYVRVCMLDTFSENSGRYTEMYLVASPDYYIEFDRVSESEKKDGTADSYGNYRSFAAGTVLRDATLDDGFNMSDCETAVSKTKVRKDFLKDIKMVVEYADKIIRENSNGSIKDIFSKVTPQSIHTAGRTWVEKEATCTQNGSKGIECKVCGAKYYESIKAGHKWELTEMITPATEVHGTGKYTCSRCGETKTEEVCISGAFKDMPAKDNWAHAGIDWAVYNKITNGTSATAFSPNSGCTRGQVVAFLWRAAGCPEPESDGNDFTDLKPGAFYEKAVAWAVEQGITNGTSKTTFGPDLTCTRGQIVTFLYRFKGQPDVGNTDTPFIDLKDGGFYLDAVAWAVENEITNGMSSDKFAPDSTCTRAQVVTFLYRAVQK